MRGQPDIGLPTNTLNLGIVEVDPGAHPSLHRHNWQAVYYILWGRGEIESDGCHIHLAGALGMMYIAMYLSGKAVMVRWQK